MARGLLLSRDGGSLRPAMRTRLLYPSLLLAPFGAAAVFAGCAGVEQGDGTDAVPRPPGAVGDSPIVETPLGPAVGGLLVVRLTDGRDEADAADAAAAAGGTIVWRGPRTGAYLVRLADTGETARAASLLGADPSVAEVRPHLIARGTGFGSSPGRVQWNLEAMGLNPESSWGSAGGVTVAVLDTGVAYEAYADAQGTYAQAPDLAGVTFASPYDFVNDDAHANDDNGHGTHVTGIIASSGDLRAVAPGVAIVPVKVLGADNLGTELGLAEGLLHAADSGADVVNLSLSFSPAFFPSRFLSEAVDEVNGAGAILVAAVGNHGSNVVTYPAAFRDVIAVAASALEADFVPKEGERPWAGAQGALDRAAYSNRGYLIDVSAPGGSIDRDLDGDGNPEAILAQSFAGDPTAFDYLFYAGTSQAAAQVSGLAALMLARNPELQRRHVRALLGDAAHGNGEALLDLDTGRGFVDVRNTLAHSSGHRALRERPRFATALRLALVDRPGGRIARAVVDVVDDAGAPAIGVEVYGTFTGGALQSGSKRTDGRGRAVFQTGALADPRVVAFQVDAVVATRWSPGHGNECHFGDDHGGDDHGGGWWSSWKTTVDRPGGFVRIDSCSLDLLTDFAEASGFGSSPGAPINLALPPLSPDEVATVALVNFSWSGATPAMAVVADRDWFDSTYPDAAERRVTGLAGGRTDTTLRFDASDSFPLPLDDVGEDCVDVVVGTFGAGFGSSPGRVPVFPDPDGSCRFSSSCDAYRLLFDRLWLEMAPPDGGVQPAWDPDSGMSEESWTQVAGMMAGYIELATHAIGSPVGEYSEALEAAGIGATPYDGSPPDDLGAGSAVWQ